MHDVTYIDATIDQLQQHVRSAQMLVKRKVLPGSRYAFTAELEQANRLIEQLRLLLERSGMSRRLGFVPDGDGVQPVIINPVNRSHEASEEGAGLPGGGAEQAGPPSVGTAEPLLERPTE